MTWLHALRLAFLLLLVLGAAGLAWVGGFRDA